MTLRTSASCQPAACADDKPGASGQRVASGVGPTPASHTHVLAASGFPSPDEYESPMATHKITRGSTIALASKGRSQKTYPRARTRYLCPASSAAANAGSCDSRTIGAFSVQSGVHSRIVHSYGMPEPTVKLTMY